jgi:ElaB/YqjD/DUF883 family membrane-anchored ribosome-binding protein
MEKLPIQSTDHSTGNTNSNSNIGNKWPDVENTIIAKSREVENMGREYITQAPIKSVLTVGVAGLFLGFLLSRFRA